MPVPFDISKLSGNSEVQFIHEPVCCDARGMAACCGNSCPPSLRATSDDASGCTLDAVDLAALAAIVVLHELIGVRRAVAVLRSSYVRRSIFKTTDDRPADTSSLSGFE